MQIASEEGGALNFTASIGTDLFFSERDKLSQGLRSLTGEANAQTASVENLYKKAASAIATYASLTAGAQLIQNIIKVRGEFEQLGVAFETMLGSKQKADKLMAETVKFAATTPFQLTEVAQTTKQLLAYGFAADDIEGTLRSLGDVASGISVPLGDIAYLYGTIKTAGVANSVDIKQFAQRGIPIYEALAKVLKVNVDEVGDFVSAGKVGFPQIEQAFKNLTGAGSQFGGLMEKQSHTLTGVLANLSDSFNQVLNSIGKANSGIAYSAIGAAQSMVDNYQTLLDVLQTAIVIYGAYKTAVLLSVAAQRFQQEALLQTALAGKELTSVQAGLAVIQSGFSGIVKSLINPTTAATAAIAGLSLIIYSLTQTVDAAAESQKNLAEIQAEGVKAGLKEHDTIQSLVSIINDKTRSHDDQVKAINKLRDVTGPYLKNYSDEEILAGKAKKGIDDYIASIEQMSKVKAASDRLTELEGKLIDIQTKGADALDFTEKFGNSLKAAFGAGDYSKKGYLDQLLGTNGASVNNVSVQKAKSDIQKQIDDIKGIYGKGLQDLALTGTTGTDNFLDAASKLSNKQLIDATTSLVDLDEVRKKIDENYNKSKDQSNRDALASDLRYADARKKAFDTYGADKVVAKTNEEAINKVNSLYEKQKSLLEQINALHHGAIQSGLLKQDSLVDKVNEKYDGILQSIKQQNDLYDKISQKYPGGITAYNKANPDNQVQRIDQSTINKVNADRTIETNNSNYKQDADEYLKHLDDQKKIFEQYQESIKQIGIDRANELYAAQTKGFDSYVAYLKDQQDKLKVSSAVSVLFGGLPDIGTQTKLKGVGEAQVVATKEANDKQYEDTKANYTRLIGITSDYNAKKKAIDDRYEKDRKQLESTYTGSDKSLRLAALKKDHDDAIDATQDEFYQRTAIYRKISQDVIQYTNSQVRAQIKSTQDIINQTKDLAPAVREQLQKQIQDLKVNLRLGSLDSFKKDLKQKIADIQRELSDNLNQSNTKKFDKLSPEQIEAYKKRIAELNNELNRIPIEKMQKASEISGAIGQSLAGLADTIKPFNEGLSDTVGILSDAATQAASLFSDVAGAAAGDPKAIASLIGKTISNYAKAFNDFQEGRTGEGILRSTGLVGGFIADLIDAGRESERKANEELKKYQDDLLKNGITYNELIRDRIRSQQDINSLTVQELETRQQLLATQKQQAQQDYQALLNQIKLNGLQVTGEHTEKYGGVLGIGRKTKTVQETTGLSDADYDTLEKLYTEGGLTDATKTWFESLKTVHDEIDGITDSAKETQDKLNNILTGTTSDAIADSIKTGLANGFSAVEDFGDNLNDVFRNAILSAFEADKIKPAVDQLYAMIAERNKDGVLDTIDIDAIRTSFNTSFAPILDELNTVKQAAGDLFSSSGSNTNQNSLIGAQSQATEQTNALLAGQFGALRLTAQQQYQVASQTLIQITLIANYTSDIPNVKAILADMQNRGVKIRA